MSVEVRPDSSLKPYNTFGIETTAAFLVEYDTEEDLLDMCESGGMTLPWLHVGAGSNLLFTRPFLGMVFHSRIRDIEVVRETADDVLLRVGGGVIWDEFVAHCVRNGWYGVENLSLIPGEVGAAAVQNIGAYGVEASDVVEKVETVSFSGRRDVFTREDCRYAYRWSIFKQADMRDRFVTRVWIRLDKKEAYKLGYGAVEREVDRLGGRSLPNVRQAVINIRQSKLPDPKVMGNAGSFFMNPVVSRECFERLAARFPDMPHYETPQAGVKIPAGWLIEQCGWKGKSLGRAAVYDRQALVLVNKGGATGNEILALSEAVSQSVEEKFGIVLKPEVNIY